MSDFFKEDNPHYLELKELLTKDEYESARESTLTAFYTPPVVIKAVYQALENMNFNMALNAGNDAAVIGINATFERMTRADNRFHSILTACAHMIKVRITLTDNGFPCWS